MSASLVASSTAAVLVVDNDPSNLVALGAVLAPLGCEIVVAHSGYEAIERTLEKDFAAILMDVRMPGLDGYAAGSFIRQNPRSTETPILFISGASDVDVAKLTKLYGSTGPVDWVQKPVEPAALRSRVLGWVQLFRKHQQVHELKRTVDSAQAEARKKDDLLAMVAHDLKGPLGAISISAAKLSRQASGGSGDPKLLASVQKHAELVERTIDRMTWMVNDLLESTRVESGAMKLDLAFHDPDAIVAQAFDLLRPLADQKGVMLEFNRRRAGGAVQCDRDRILQVLSNLIGNAVKFTPSAGKVELDTTNVESEVVICVRDSGPGIPAEQVPFVFEKYWQGKHESANTGVGLGLAIAKAIAVAHGGKIWVESRVGEGSRFYFSIPREGRLAR